MTWTLRDAKRERGIVDKIDQGDDRSAAILAEAFLEDRLTKAILARLKEDKIVVGEMFKGYGPLASFKAKIDLAFLMSIIETPMHVNLHRIRKIRNRFAHRLEAHDFEVPIIRDLCDKLLHISTITSIKQEMEQELGKTDRDLGVFAIWLSPMVTLSDTPRNAYMNTIKIILLMIEVGTHFATKDRTGVGFSLALAVPASFLGKSEQQLPPTPQTGDRVPRRLRRRREPSSD